MSTETELQLAEGLLIAGRSDEDVEREVGVTLEEILGLRAQMVIPERRSPTRRADRFGGRAWWRRQS